MTIKTKPSLVTLDYVWRAVPKVRVMASTTASNDLTLDRFTRACPSAFFGGGSAPPPPPPPTGGKGNFFLLS